jgi:hypothetical protein
MPWTSRGATPEEGPRLDTVHGRATDRSVYAGYTPAETRRALKRKEEPSYQGTFTGARKYVLQTFATTQSAMMKRRVAQFLSSSDCPVCKGKRLKPEALSVTFAGMDIAEVSRLPLKGLNELLGSQVHRGTRSSDDHPEKALVVQRILEDTLARLAEEISAIQSELVRQKPQVIAVKVSEKHPGLTRRAAHPGGPEWLPRRCHPASE